jgi:hypothetical protein
MAEAEPARQVSRSRAGRWVVRLVVVVAGLWVSGWLLNRLATRPGGGGAERPGFASGMAHGALMPMALPRLLAGGEVRIYAVENAGRFYDLGYTCGVNVSGAFFFGLMYRRRRSAGAGGGGA